MHSNMDIILVILLCNSNTSMDQSEAADREGELSHFTRNTGIYKDSLGENMGTLATGSDQTPLSLCCTVVGRFLYG